MSGPAQRPSALVLGGAGGIGAAVSRRLARESAVAIGCLHGRDRAEALREEIQVAGGVAGVVAADVSTEEGVVRAFDTAEGMGELRIVVNCVGGWTYPKVTDLSVAEIEAAIRLNLVSALLVLRESARRVADNGRVVMLSSAAAELAPARQSVYAAAKAGVEAATRVAAKELAVRGVLVNVVRPGATDTETLRRGTSPRAIEAMANSNAMRRLGTPEDIAGAVCLLTSADAGWITGTVLDATGGLV